MTDPIRCMHCGDKLSPVAKCRKCKGKFANFQQCEECHMELAHGQLQLSPVHSRRRQW